MVFIRLPGIEQVFVEILTDIGIDNMSLRSLDKRLIFSGKPAPQASAD
jgi:hypothetical protein